MKARLKFLLIILISVFVYAIYYWVVPWAVNINSRVGLIQSYFKNEFGANIEIVQPKLKMGLTPSIWLEAKRLSISDKNSKPFLVEHPKLKIRLLPLFIGKFQPAYFSCDKINAKLRLDKHSRLYIGDFLFVKSSNPKLSFENSKMDINTYDILFNDDLNNKKIHLTGDYFNLAKFNSQNGIKFSANSQIDINGDKSFLNADVAFNLPLEKSFDANELIFDGTLTNLNLSNLSPYIKIVSKGNILKSSGILNIHADTKALGFGRKSRINANIVSQNLLLQIKEQPEPTFLKDKFIIDTAFDVSKNAIDIKKFSLNAQNIHFNADGKISKIDTKNPKLNINVSIKDSRMENFVAIMPHIKYSGEDINFEALKKYNFYATINGKISISGKSDKPSIKGNFLVNDAYMIKGLNISPAVIKLNFLGEKLKFDVTVPSGPKQAVFVKGLTELYGRKSSILDISSTQNVDLHIAEVILKPLHEILSFELGPIPVMTIHGDGNIKLKVTGTKKAPVLFGAFHFRNSDVSFDGINAQIKNGDGSLYFKNNDTHFVTKKAFLDSKPIKIDGKCSLIGDLDFDIISNSQELGFLLNILKTSEMLADLKTYIPDLEKASGKLNCVIKLKGKVQNVKDFAIGKNVFLSGNLKLLGNSITLKGLNFSLSNVFGNIKFDDKNADFNLYSLVDKSKVLIKGSVNNGKLNLKAKLNDVKFESWGVPIKIIGGNIEIHNNTLILYKINALADSMPILLDGTVSDIFKNPKYDLYVNSKPSQKFIDKHINKNTTYPLKVKGDVLYSARITGKYGAISAKAEINLSEGSSIYYMGSTLGDENNPIRIYLDTTIGKNTLTVNNFQYDKLITSQNDKEFITPQLNAKGDINFSKKDLSFNNFRIRTQNPTDARIFNILFKKPLIKQGLFTSGLILNDSMASPKLVGFLNFTGIDIPLLDTTIKDISLDFGYNLIEVKSKGEIFSNKIVAFANMKNKLTPPYTLSAVDIYLGNLDINQVAKSINKLQFDPDSSNQTSTEIKNQLDPSSLIVTDAKVKADSVLIKNIYAKNLEADFSLNEKMLFNVDNFKFDIAQGKVNGNFKYNLLTANSTLGLDADEVNANSISEALFDLPNQIYGSLTGQVDLSCNGKSHKSCMDTLSGRGGFRVIHGKMPKLGSMEYLLRAANIMKSGVTGVTINSLIELLTPLKTGEFESITGSFDIDSGVAKSVQIFSKGKDLSLFLTGTYNFTTLIADMKVFGRLSKKITNALGVVGNTSLNTLFSVIPGTHLNDTNSSDFLKQLNKIPGFELEDTAFRVFSVDIYGDINGDKYVQSFKWID